MENEHFKTPEERAEEIDGLIENLAQNEGMSADDIFSDVNTFAEICQEDEDAKAYFEELAERLNMPAEELIEYAINRTKEE
ncbi:MAG: hypothetical protein EXS48_02970 [Candidatus Staskawiczbacteria bacterium]|nr:hypothetical protein [Candidatus Staskawiczbacteria bacterium]